MTEITRNSYSLYQRQIGSKTVWYVRFWDNQLQKYTCGRSTGQTGKAAANRVAQQWLSCGIPKTVRQKGSTSQTRILGAIKNYLIESGAVAEGEVIEPSRALRLFFHKATGEEIASDEKFVDYLLRFWSWDSSYVQGRLDRGRSISKAYVNDCHVRVERHIAPFFKDILLCDVTPKMIEAFIQSIPRRENDSEKGLAKRTINAILKTMKVALKEAVRLEILSRNPAEKVDALAEDTRYRGILTTAELQKLFTLEWKDKRGKYASILGAVSGMRLGEIVALQYEDLDFNWNVIHVRHGFSSKEHVLKKPKNGRERLIYTDDHILRLLDELYQENPHGNSFIFWGLNPCLPVRIETIESYFEKAANALLGEDVRKKRNITFHSFRHFFNSTIRGSVSDETLRLQTGHLNEKMTDHYDHMTDERGEQLRKAIQLKILPFVQVEGL